MHYLNTNYLKSDEKGYSNFTYISFSTWLVMHSIKNCWVFLWCKFVNCWILHSKYHHVELISCPKRTMFKSKCLTFFIILNILCVFLFCCWVSNFLWLLRVLRASGSWDSGHEETWLRLRYWWEMTRWVPSWSVSYPH